MNNSNPLSRHFRQPSLYLKLPSNGRYWLPNTINLPANGEVGVMPMTAKDEIMLRTPDALMNGQGVVSVIESCIPEIKNAWAIPSIDVDAILIAIRIATYGDVMDVDSKCPKCSTESRHQIALNPLLLRIKTPNYNKTSVVDGLTFKFKPQNYMQSNKINIIDFEEQKLLQVIADDSLDSETRKATFNVHLQNIIDSSVLLLSNCTESITTEDGTIVTNHEHINEFYKNANNKIIKEIQNILKDYADQTKLPNMNVKCESCDAEYKVEVTFDYANFFDPLS